MMRRLLLAALLVGAGCAAPTAPPATDSPTPTEEPWSPTPTRGSPAPTATPAERARPPGVSDGRLVDATALLAAHEEASVRAGFVSVANGSAPVTRHGIRVNVTASGRHRVEPNATDYRYWNVTEAGPVQRRIEGWSNGSVEYRRRVGVDGATYVRAESRSPAELASVWLLATHLRAGNYSVRSVDDRGETTLVTLVANRIDNRTAARRALPDGGGNITGYEATLVVDLAGRIRSLSVRMTYELDGRPATLRLEYELRRVGGVEVARPDWVTDATEGANGSASSRRPAAVEPTFRPRVRVGANGARGLVILPAVLT